MEHIISSQVMHHLEDNQILYEWQHGFRSKRSCETQLITLIQDLAQNISGTKFKQTDIIITDFSKAFDKVPHKRLLYKLQYYGVNNTTLKWIESFLGNRSQEVVLPGGKSDPVPVESGVPQGLVLGPILFLIYVNDLPEGMTSGVRLFADDCIIYRPVKTLKDAEALQKDLKILEKWVADWLMELNPTKCKTMSVTRSPTPIVHPYTLLGHTLETEKTDYLGVSISKDLRWNKHIDTIIAKATSTLGVLKRNLKTSRTLIKERAYNTLVRPKVEYCSTVWDPHTQENKKKLEMVQRRAARYVCNRYNNTSSVGSMLADLGWDTLEHRRASSRMCMMYRMVHGLVAIPIENYVNSSQNSK